MTLPLPLPTAPHLSVLPRPQRPRTGNPAIVAQRVCDRLGVTFDAVAGRARGGQVGFARREVARALRAQTAMSLADIGRFLGGRDHSTVINLVRR